MKATDWTQYYSKKKSVFSTLTQKTTNKIIINSIIKYVKKKDRRILELGGGNSCFFESVCKHVNIRRYDIVDNCELAVDLFNNKKQDVEHKGIYVDLLDSDVKCDAVYDFVYSVGLIEHFRGKDIDAVIQKHFEYCKLGGYVLISVPTPTRKYRLVRKWMEKLGVWQFWDEKPLIYIHIKDKVEKYGNIQEVFINNKLPLTQMVVIARKKKQ